MAIENASLEGLPNELLSEVLLHLRTIRSFETQSTAFKQKGTEKRRQRENRLRQLALYSVCLTSRHLNRIATPILYASFTGSTTRHGIESLRLFHRTLAEPKAPTENKDKYAGHLQYVENRLADHLGNDLFADTVHPDAARMVEEYFSLLAEIVNSAPNLQHLSVVSLENLEVSFWRHVLHEQKNAATPSFIFVADHSFSKLEVLCIQTNTTPYATEKEASLESICSAVASLPSLYDFRISGLAMDQLKGSEVNIGPFKNLQRVEITECIANTRLVADILSACKDLRHVACEWAYLECWGETPFDLRRAILQHSSTLETLAFDFRRIAWDYRDTPFRDIGSLQQFERLESLKISRIGFLGGYWHDPNRHQITELFPIGLKKFCLLLDETDFTHAFEDLDNLPELIILLEACKSSTLNLVEMTVTNSCEINGVEELGNEFAQAGVLFKAIIEPEEWL